MLNVLADPRVGIERLKGLIDFDLNPYPLDELVPVDDVPETQTWSRSMQDYYLGRARDEKLTVRQMALIAMQFDCVAMGVDEVVDHIDEWVTNGAADGFNICFGDASGSLDVFVDHAIPELQRRGLFRTEYQGRTLRENLGLPLPQNRLAGATAKA
jgi:alkanesulfonate monooxygenase